ncbi:MAG: hypothetical protein IJC30_03640 [Alphaproteobacteria bacterium]|nr:hypothetical protein [Alphaproteobacteria bacterium]
MDVDAKTIVETFEIIGALLSCIGAGIGILREMDKCKKTQKVSSKNITCQQVPCHTMG